MNKRVYVWLNPNATSKGTSGGWGCACLQREIFDSKDLPRLQLTKSHKICIFQSTTHGLDGLSRCNDIKTMVKLIQTH